MKLKGRVRLISESKYNTVEKMGEVQKWERTGSSTIYIFNDKGNLIEDNSSNPDGTIFEKHTYKYDGNGNLIEMYWYNPYGSLAGKSTYKYDGNGSMIEENFYNPYGSLAGKSTYKYDSNGNRIEINNSTPPYYSWKFTFKYDGNGNEIESNSYKQDGSLDLKSTYKKYSYDKNLNWIKRIEFINDGPPYISERVIEYF